MGGLCRTMPTLRTSGAAQRSTSTRFSRERNLPTLLTRRSGAVTRRASMATGSKRLIIASRGECAESGPGVGHHLDGPRIRDRDDSAGRVRARQPVSATYVAPKDAAHQPIYEHLKELRFLEKLQEFLSPFQLPRILLVKVEGCDGNPDASYENDMIVVCYEYIDQLWKAIPPETTPA